MHKTLLVLASSSLLLGCQPKQEIVCQEMKRYSAMTQAAFAEEFEAVKKQYPTVTQFIADYHQLRNAIRRCQGK